MKRRISLMASARPGSRPARRRTSTSVRTPPSLPYPSARLLLLLHVWRPHRSRSRAAYVFVPHSEGLRALPRRNREAAAQRQGRASLGQVPHHVNAANAASSPSLHRFSNQHRRYPLPCNHHPDPILSQLPRTWRGVVQHALEDLASLNVYCVPPPFQATSLHFS